MWARCGACAGYDSFCIHFRLLAASHLLTNAQTHTITTATTSKSHVKWTFLLVFAYKRCHLLMILGDLFLFFIWLQCRYLSLTPPTPLAGLFIASNPPPAPSPCQLCVAGLKNWIQCVVTAKPLNIPPSCLHLSLLSMPWTDFDATKIKSEWFTRCNAPYNLDFALTYFVHFALSCAKERKSDHFSYCIICSSCIGLDVSGVADVAARHKRVSVCIWMATNTENVAKNL